MIELLCNVVSRSRVSLRRGNLRVSERLAYVGLLPSCLGMFVVAGSLSRSRVSLRRGNLRVSERLAYVGLLPSCLGMFVGAGSLSRSRVSLRRGNLRVSERLAYVGLLPSCLGMFVVAGSLSRSRVSLRRGNLRVSERLAYVGLLPSCLGMFVVAGSLSRSRVSLRRGNLRVSERLAYVGLLPSCLGMFVVASSLSRSRVSLRRGNLRVSERLAYVGLLPSCLGMFVVAGSLSGAEPGNYLGSPSCATSTCHGSTNSGGPAWTHALSTHRANDPHATAGLLLLDEDSQRIVHRLDRRSQNSSTVYANVLRTRCLSCHATATPAECEPSNDSDPSELRELLGNGVSCESCHGPASGWVDEHLNRSWPNDLGRTRTGFRETKSVFERADNCVRCHVGSRTADGLVRDVNHDLIAAGHPALRFDLLIYHQNLPIHWDVDEPSERDFDASSIRLREVGRAIGLAAAGKLASERATDHLADSKRVPWPELADYDCFACHQQLSTLSYHLPSSEVQKSKLHISDGLPVWNAWYSISQLDLRDDPELLNALSPHRSDPAKLIDSGLRISQDYRRLAREAAGRTPSPITMLGTITDQLRRRPPVDWHEAAVALLRIEAIVDDLRRRPSDPMGAAEIADKLPQLFERLRFDASSKSDGSSIPQSPLGFNAEKFRKQVLALFRLQPDTPASNAPQNNALPIATLPIATLPIDSP